MYLFLLLVSFINIFMISGSTKWLIFGPTFVPMLMQIGIHPTFLKLSINVGTIISYMAPYTIGYILITSVVVLAWLFLEIPPGIGSAVFL